MNPITAILPDRIKNRLRTIIKFLKSLPYFGFRRYCPVCRKYSNRFLVNGIIPRNDALCYYCQSLERHRFVWIFIKNRTDLFNGKKKIMLHIAPEKSLEKKFKDKLGFSYLTADLFNDSVMEKMDITDINYQEEYFDVIYCSHVLEHVEDDIKALGELHRVLNTKGWAIILVPVTSDKTFEDPSIVSPEDRLRVFGQEDHVRRYGPDFSDRLCDAGFNVEVFSVKDVVEKKKAIMMGLTEASGEIFFCTK